MEQKEYIIDRFKKNGLTIDDEQAGQLLLFFSMLVEKNKVMNLTAITEFEEVVDKHFIDSAILLKYTDIENKSVIDVGTGAGFPGIPLKILCPSMNLMLLDSLNKRINFLNEVIESLGLKNVTAIHSRAEELAVKPGHREGYDIVVSRAVSNLSTLVEYCLPFLRPNGMFYSYKGSKAEEELTAATNAIRILGGSPERKYEIEIEGTDYDRQIIAIRKERPTPKKYPRSGNKPNSDPIK